MRTAILLTFAVSLTAFAAPVPKAVKKQDDDELLQGRWESVTCDEGRGHKPNTTYWLEVKDGKLSTGTNGRPSGYKQVPFTLDPTQSPKHLDIKSTGLEPYIYDIDGDTLTTCHGRDGTRPTGMQSTKAYYCTVWKRVKEEGK